METVFMTKYSQVLSPAATQKAEIENLNSDNSLQLGLEHIALLGGIRFKSDDLAI
jgi:hypothetical protein